MILVDSSGWIEYLAARPGAALFAPYLEGRQTLLASALQVYEIYKVVRRDVSEERAIEAVSALGASTVVPVEETLALEAADLALQHGLAMADAVIYATARRYRARLVTADSDFEGLPGAEVLR